MNKNHVLIASFTLHISNETKEKATQQRNKNNENELGSFCTVSVSDIFANTYRSGCPLRALDLVIYILVLLSLLLDSFILATLIAGA